MILFFKSPQNTVIAVDSDKQPSNETIGKLSWLFSEAEYVGEGPLTGNFIGPRKEMITPWSTNAVEITQNMGISGIRRIEEFLVSDQESPEYDPMLSRIYHTLDSNIFSIAILPVPIQYIEDISGFNQQEGLALSEEEVAYLVDLSKRLGRKLTDSEIFGFSQVNSEHCRHKIFNGQFIIDGKEMDSSLFQLIKKTTNTHPNSVVSAYKDNCAFLSGPVIDQFAPKTQNKPDFFEIKPIESVLSLKAETHNFPTTVEPFNGAATGTGGEIRDRIAGGKAALPLSGTAVYMTSYSRLEDGREWEKNNPERKWLYQTPSQILIKASNGASDFGNKFGQPLTCGSVLTFEHTENQNKFGFDKVIMLAGGIGYGKKSDAEKGIPEKGDSVVLMGGDNYRIGMGGGAVSSVATGEYNHAIELNAVQRSNPEMQKRVCNAIRAMAESDINPIVSIHDHGAGGHLNCLSELVESTGGKIDMSELPVGDPTLSAKEIVGNESQERMGLVLKEKDIRQLKEIAERERAPMYVIGKTTGDDKFVFEDKDGNKPIDLLLEDMFGNPPKTIMKDAHSLEKFRPVEYKTERLRDYLDAVLQLESVGCKDWLTNKVDRSVTGRVAKQQTAGTVQLPLNNLAVSALDFTHFSGIATSIGHAPVAGLVDAEAGSVLSIAEALTNIVWAPLKEGMKSVSLSANWMWPCKNPGEDARLYDAVKAASDFAIALGINIPTGKDSLSMTQKYPDGTAVLSPGTVIISAAGEVSDFRKVVEPVLQTQADSVLLYVPMTDDPFCLGGSSFAQVTSQLGQKAPTIRDAKKFLSAFNLIQDLVREGKILAGHDVSAGGLITCILEMCFGRNDIGLEADISALSDEDIIRKLFSERPAVVLQVKASLSTGIINQFRAVNITVNQLATVNTKRIFTIANGPKIIDLDINSQRDIWFKPSWLLEQKQTRGKLAHARYANYKTQELRYRFPEDFKGKLSEMNLQWRRPSPSGIRAAIIREKGVNGDREMAYSLYQAGFDVKDVHMTDLIAGRESLDEINMIVFVGGFSNSDVLGSAKGWAGAFRYNQKAQETLNRFYSRKDTLSLGVCNGCQVMIELGLIGNDQTKVRMSFNDSHKFESAFLNVDIPENTSVMLGSLAGSRLGIWVAHGEGKFNLPEPESSYHVALKYSYEQYPGNPNGSDYTVAGLCSADGRHLAMMPHLERAIYPWNWASYPSERKGDEITPWIEAFVNARKWIEEGK
ncbi:MAG: phosphoribosylformylglycinamidine synthase [Bacteroidales bacterium]|nr:phosphoribosylformylglycinamidine synthase [Bacteroidales bacterium]